MEAEVGKREDDLPQLLDLISNEKDWFNGDEGGGGKSLGASEEVKLDLTLAPPGEGFQEENLGSFPLPSSFGKESSLEANRRIDQSHERGLHSSTEDGVLVKNKSPIRMTSSPVVGWPPVRSFRKNIAICSSKTPDVLQNAVTLENRLRIDTSNRGFFVKINVDGIPIGRKLDLNAYANYEMLSSVVEELFCGLLSVSCTEMGEDAKRAFTGLLDGSSEYTLVYEDNEGDRMLVGDVPWDMFVSTAKRLRVMKNSELSALFPGAMNTKRAEEC